MYHVELVDLPHSIRGFIRHNTDGSDTIVLNARHTRETQIQTFKHELKHIERDDFYSELSADEIESEAHNVRFK